MNLILFVLTLVVVFIVVRIGAVAFQLTGLEWSLAKFQALSCFTGTGFTTREAELIVGHPQRRRIASILMVVGNGGLVTLIATFANSVRPRISGTPSTWGWIWSGPEPLINFTIIAGVVYLTFRFFTRSRAARHLTEFVRHRMKASGLVEPVSFEELVVSTGGYGVASAEVPKGNPLVGQTLASSRLRDNDITVLVVRRGDTATPNPPCETTISVGDTLVCFGRLDHVREVFQAGTPA